jgi:hypothetical protein
MHWMIVVVVYALLALAIYTGVIGMSVCFPLFFDGEEYSSVTTYNTFSLPNCLP